MRFTKGQRVEWTDCTYAPFEYRGIVVRSGWLACTVRPIWVRTGAADWRPVSPGTPAVRIANGRLRAIR